VVPVLAIRHAATEWNAAGLLQGRRDLPLSESGRAAVRGWRVPEGWTGARCLSSPLLRARETASLLGLAPGAEPLLIEMDWGSWEGRRLDELRAELGAAMAENEARGLDFRPAGGESPREVQARLQLLLPTLGEPTILVAHKGVLRALYALATGWTMQEKPADRLRDAHAHAFAVGPGGAVAVERLNIPLRSGA
jgi:broad specificity phosphatase PhoE